MGERLRVVDGKGEGIDRPHRHPGEDEMVEPERVDKAFDVLALRCDGIIGVRRPVSVAMAALIERNAVKLVAQSEAAEIPGMRRQGAAMQEKERPQLLIAPIEGTATKVTDEHGLIARQYDIVEAEAGANRSGLQMIVIFVGGLRHGLAAPYTASAGTALARTGVPA